MRITEQQADWLAEDLHELLDICDLDTDWYSIQSISKMNHDGRYFIFMKSECYNHLYREVVCDLHFNCEHAIGISNAEFAPHGHPCNSEEIYIFEEVC
jgi:hypothetical protein